MGKKALTTLSYEDLAKEMTRRERSVKQLQRKRDRLLAELAEVETEIQSIGGKTRQHAGGSRRPRNERTLPEAMAETLKGKTLSVTELAEAVQQDGYKTTSPNFRTIVNQTLLKDERFKRVSRGKYALKARPSRKKTTKAKPAG